MATTSGDTATAILDAAERLVQHRGFNAFSYADIAAELGVTRASLHYHFAGKSDLGAGLLRRYSERFARALDTIDGGTGPSVAKLAAYCDLYRVVLTDGRMCLCGMLAGEFETLPAAMQDANLEFLDANRAWLSGLLRSGREAGELHFSGSDEDAAAGLLATLEGAVLVARPNGGTEVFDRVVRQAVGAFT